jgi:hypothetical protein
MQLGSTPKVRSPVLPPAAGSGKARFGIRPAFLPVIPPVIAKGQGRKGGSLPDPRPVGQLPRLDASPDNDGGDHPDAEEAPEECLEDVHDQPDADSQVDAEEAPEECPEEASEEAYEDEPDNNESKRVRRSPASAV